MVVAGWAWDDGVFAVGALGLVWRVLVVWLVVDVLFVWVWARAMGRAR